MIGHSRGSIDLQQLEITIAPSCITSTRPQPRQPTASNASTASCFQFINFLSTQACLKLILGIVGNIFSVEIIKFMAGYQSNWRQSLPIQYRHRKLTTRHPAFSNNTAIKFICCCQRASANPLRSVTLLIPMLEPS